MAMINVNIEMSGWDDPKKQFPYALSKAINAVATDAQVVERKHLEDVFTVRRKSFAERAVKVKPFATKQSLTATISIDPPGGQKRDVFSKFEKGGEKHGLHGGLIAIPTSNVRKNPKTVISAAKRPRNLSDSFKLMFEDGTGGIYQRRHYAGNKKSRLTMMYFLTPEVPIPADLKFIETKTEMVNRMWTQRFNEAWVKAYETAR